MLQAGGGVNYVTALRGAGSSIATSLWTAAVAATVMVSVGLLLAYLVERTARERRNILDTALVLLFAVTGISTRRFGRPCSTRSADSSNAWV